MSNYLKNLAKRSAGLPLSTAGFPTASPALETRFRSGEGLDEIAMEEPATLHPAAAQPHLINVASSSSAHEVQRATAMGRGTANPQPGGPTLIHTSSSTAASQAAKSTSVLQAQPQPDSEPRRTNRTLAPPTAFASHDYEVNEGSRPTFTQTTALPPESGQVESNLQATLGQTLLRPLATAKRTEGDTPGTSEAPADQAIRPAGTERASSFQFPKIMSASPQTPAPLPIHVHVGRIEVRKNAPPEAPARQAPKETTPLGFAGYQRMRRYRN